MYKKELTAVSNGLIGETLSRPSGQLSGHVSGLPFEVLVYAKLRGAFPVGLYRHHEALNSAILHDQRLLGMGNPNADYMFGPEDTNYLVKRSPAALAAWTPTNQFEQKQDDTAECILFGADAYKFHSFTTLIDVKSENLGKSGRPQNIISLAKIANVCELVLSKGIEPNFQIIYISAGYEATANQLVCKESRALNLFRVPPTEMIYNFTASQIQFKPTAVTQDYRGEAREWMIDYLERYTYRLNATITKKLEAVKRINSLLTSL